MKIADAEIKEIVKMLEGPGRSMGTENVFRDWCECSALALANGCDLLHGPVWERREKRYLDVIGRYDDPSLFAEMLAHLTNAFEAGGKSMARINFKLFLKRYLTFENSERIKSASATGNGSPSSQKGENDGYDIRTIPNYLQARRIHHWDHFLLVRQESMYDSPGYA